MNLLLTLLFSFSNLLLVLGIELTFELPDNARDCYYEVVTGGQYDVDVVIEGPNGEILFQEYKSQYDSHEFTAQISGPYAVCFSNEFSTFSHKVVYMDFQVGDEEPLPTLNEHITVMTLMESSSLEIHSKLNTINDFQTHHRLREATGRKRAEDLNRTVFWFCVAETIIIFATMVSQVFIVRNLFNDNRSKAAAVPYRRLH